MFALSAPVEVGPNFASTLHVLLALRVLAPSGQAGVAPSAAEVRLNSVGFVPVSVMLVIFSVSVPLLVTCTCVAALVVPTFWLPKGTLVGLSVTAGKMPVPVRGTVCGLPAASSATLTLAVRAPVVVGPKLAPKKQLLLGAMALAPNEHAGEPLVGATKLKSPGFVPVLVMLVMLSVALPLLVSLTFVRPLVVPTR